MVAIVDDAKALALGTSLELRGAGTAADVWTPRVPAETDASPALDLDDAERRRGNGPDAGQGPAAPRLPWAAKVYVGAVIAVGAGLLGLQFPSAVPDPVLTASLLALVLIGSAFKVQLPVIGTTATLSVSFIADFMALILLGPSQAMLFAGLGGGFQCLVNRQPGGRLQAYRVIFSIAALIVTVQVTSVAYSALGGHPGLLDPNDLVLPIVGGAFAYFVCNAVLVAVASALATGQSPWRVWHEAFLWSGPSFFAGAGVAVAAAWSIARGDLWSALLLTAPAWLTYRTYEVYLGRIDDERRHAAEVSDLNTKMTKALDQARRSERALAIEKERLGVTLGSIGEAVLAADTRGRVVLMNHTAETFTGWRADDGVGRPIAEVFHLLDRESGKSYANPVDQVLRTQAAVERDNHAALMARDGTQRLVEHSATPVRDNDGTVVAVVLVARDTTDAVRVEAERTRASKLSALGVLAGGLAHDFNNILTAIVGNISLAQLDDTTASQRMNLAEAEKACLRAKGLTQQLLTFSKGGAPVKKLIVLQDLIREAAGFALRGSNVRCEFRVSDNLWAIDADENQIVQVVHNLVLNAAQAMPGGGVVEIRADNIVVDADGDNPGRPQVRIVVRDRGVGIPQDHLGKIFDPYFTTKSLGSGLGLATSYSIVTAHGGEIGVQSVVDQGTTMTVCLPAVGYACRPVPADTRPTLAQGRGRILIMDDEAPVRDVARAMLSRLGYRTEVAADGRAAIEAYTHARASGDPFHAVIMDLTIPGGMGGKDAVKALLEIDPGVTAIVSSGYADAPVMAEYERYGFKGVVPKPFTIADLSRLLQQVLASHAA